MINFDDMSKRLGVSLQFWISRGSSGDMEDPVTVT